MLSAYQYGKTKITLASVIKVFRRQCISHCVLLVVRREQLCIGASRATVQIRWFKFVAVMVTLLLVWSSMPCSEQPCDIQ